MQTKNLVNDGMSTVKNIAKAIGLPIWDDQWMPPAQVGKAWQVARDDFGHESLRCPWATVEHRTIERPDPTCHVVPTLGLGKTGKKGFCETHKRLAKRCDSVQVRETHVVDACSREFAPFRDESPRDLKDRLEEHLAQHRGMRSPTSAPPALTL